MKAIILAAGQSKRMLSSMKDLPKCLGPLNDSTILERLIRQLLKFDITDVSIVVGYHASLVISHVRENIGHEILFIENCRYKADVNILSLSLAVKRDIAPCYVFEADCVFDDKCFELLLDPAYEDRSVWFSCGDFTEGQHGGILKGDENGRIVDIKIVDAYKWALEQGKMIFLIPRGLTLEAESFALKKVRPLDSIRQGRIFVTYSKDSSKGGKRFIHDNPLYR